MYFFGFSRYANYRAISYRSHTVILDGTHQSVFFPCDTLLLVGIGVGEAFNLTGLAAEQAVQIWADLVAFAFLQVVALSASRLEETSALLSVTWMRVLVSISYHMCHCVICQ